MPAKLLGLVLVCLVLVGGAASAAAKQSSSHAPRGVEGQPGVIKYIGSGRIDQGPKRPGFDYDTGGTATRRTQAERQGDSNAHIVPNPLKQRVAATAASRSHGGRTGREARVASSNRQLRRSFDGLNVLETILPPGNIDLEPPDQGLCVGNGYVLESVNSALRVYDTRGRPLTEPIALSQFYGYPPVFDPETEVFGPVSVDVSCYYDPDTRRWFHVALTFNFDPEAGFPRRLDLAVSRGSSPLGRWNHYSIPGQNDGTEGTPDHGCGGPCLADFPHIGADRHGFYITTNEFPAGGEEDGGEEEEEARVEEEGGVPGVNLYAISKRQLAAGHRHPNIVQFFPVRYPFGGRAFRIWPALSPGGVYETDGNGTEYLVSTIHNLSCWECTTHSWLALWAVVNTKSLESRHPAPRLVSDVVRVKPYTGFEFASFADQRPGDLPLAECINDTTIETPFGTGCWNYFFPPEEEPAHDEVESLLDPGFDIFQVYFADGRLWTAQPTRLTFHGEEKAGIAYYVLRPSVTRSGLDVRVEREGQFGLANNHLIFPSVAATNDGEGVISFTLVGEDHYPSAAYVTLDRKRGAGDIHIAAPGLGPVDGSSGYAAFGYGFQRFGDYGAAAVDGDSIWVATEYIAQTCTLEEYLTDTEESPLGTCGRTRTPIANWATRISRIDP